MGVNKLLEIKVPLFVLTTEKYLTKSYLKCWKKGKPGFKTQFKTLVEKVIFSHSYERRSK
ncbi:MAG: hypothetical protein AAY43_05570 [Methanosarcina sp. 795]|jgi:hypothetical protein|nr:MAG: hypothetical protein AAY43_05570 [Methanosarcina sp. 795]